MGAAAASAVLVLSSTLHGVWGSLQHLSGPEGVLVGGIVGVLAARIARH